MLKEIQKLDYDRYLSLLFCPREKREDILTVILFNLEIARIRHKVSEPMMGHIRFQWWREAMDEIFDPARVPRRHDIILKLSALVSGNRVDKVDFLKIIDSRETDLEEVPFDTVAGFLEYAEGTSYPVNKMILDILEVNDPAVSSAVRQISTAWAICAILRSAYRNFTSQRSVFPQELMDKHNLVATDFGKDEFLARSQEIVKELYDIAEKNLIEAEARLKSASRENKGKATAVLLNMITVQNHLKQIRKNRYDVFSRTLNPYLGIGSLVRIYFKMF